MTRRRVARGDANWTHFWRLPEGHGAEFLHASFSDYAYARHVHSRYVFGVTTGGTEAFWHRGVVRTATVGQMVVVNPGDVHDGYSKEADTPWTRRIIYLAPEFFAEVAAEVSGRAGLPLFREGVLDDPGLARRLVAYHTDAEAGLSALERDQRLRDLVAELIRRHAGGVRPALAAGREPAAVRRAREILDGQFAAEVTLDDLGALTGLAPLYLARVFRQSVGLPPHAYQTQRRVQAAADMLRAGRRPAEVAAACGFADQSHLTRLFKRTVGVTPAKFRLGTFKKTA